jgi:hypothetical protein
VSKSSLDAHNVVSAHYLSHEEWLRTLIDEHIVEHLESTLVGLHIESQVIEVSGVLLDDVVASDTLRESNGDWVVDEQEVGGENLDHISLDLDVLDSILGVVELLDEIEVGLSCEDGLERLEREVISEQQVIEGANVISELHRYLDDVWFSG